MQKIPVYLITGFLGSGKTTFIQKAIEYFSGKVKIGVIQNEFAPANFDGKELKRETNNDFDLLEINNGSVFCVCLLSGFVTSLKKFVLKYNPDILLIEASGLSDIISVGQIFNSPELQEIVYLAGTIGIVDACHYLKIKDLMPRVKHQLMIADHLLINKTDISQHSDEINKLMDEINPFAKKYFTTYCNTDFKDIFQSASHPSWQKLPKFMLYDENNERPNVHSSVYRTVKPILSDNFTGFIHELASISYRIKGFVNVSNNKCFSVQAVFQDVHYKEILTVDINTELIVIGKDIDIKELKSIYQKYTKVNQP